MTSYASKTDFDKLYSQCYWGVFPLIDRNGNDQSPKKEIIDNRNSFAIEYKLKKSLNYTAKGHTAIKNIFKYTLDEIQNQGVYVDHIEYYDTGYSVICVTSHCCFDEKENIWIKYGFHKIPPIYCINQKSFLLELFYGRKF
jgi:hypothetical protein